MLLQTLLYEFVKLATLQQRYLEAKQEQPHCFNNYRAVEFRKIPYLHTNKAK